MYYWRDVLFLIRYSDFHEHFKILNYNSFKPSHPYLSNGLEGAISEGKQPLSERTCPRQPLTWEVSLSSWINQISLVEFLCSLISFFSFALDFAVF